MFKILFVCMGNICRSPMVEGLARQKLEARDLSDRVMVDSAGTLDYHAGRTPDPRAVATAQRHGYNIAALRARQVIAEDYTEFDMLLAMDAANFNWLRTQAPVHAVGRIKLLRALAEGVDNAEIPDPYQGDESDFELVHRLADRALNDLFDRLGPAWA